MKHIFLYNPLAGKGKAEKFINEATKKFGDDLSLHDITKIDNFPDFFAAIAPNDHIIVCGGDGTLNRFLNSAKNISQTLTYCPAGSGNDFMNDLNRTPEDGAFEINQYIKNLPSVKVGENIYRFVNGVGFGVDGYVCAEGNRLRDKQKKVNYTGIALKGLLFAFKPVNATVVVDGKEYKYKKVWMTTTMKGRFFGGGMMVTPDQDRFDPEGKISVLIAHDLGKLKIATLFPSIFKGKHVKYTKYIDIFKCDSISVKYDRPCFLQMDGESIAQVTEYSATVGSGLRAVPSMHNL